MNDIKKFIDEVLEVDEDEANGEIKEDKLNNAVTYKVNDLSVRFYLSTGKLKLFGVNQIALLNKLH